MSETVVSIIMGGITDIKQSIAEDKRDATESRRRVYDKLEDQSRAMYELTARVATVESSVASMAPSVAEFNSMRTKAAGAGKLGRFLWVTGGIVLSWALWIVTSFSSITAWFKPPSTP